MKENLSIEDLLRNPEELVPELQDYLELDGPFPRLRHPLVYQVPYTPIFNSIANHQLQEKRERIRELRKLKDWRRMIYLYERPYRILMLATLKPRDFTPQQYWDIVGDILVDTENAYQCQKEIRKLLKCKLPNREAIMEGLEQEALATLPERIRVFRGHDGRNSCGFSWTVSQWWAGWFAERYASGTRRQATINAGWVNKKDVIALFLRRNEMEVLVLPENVQDVTVWQEPAREGLYEAAWNIALGQSKLGKTSPHGRRHWAKVEENVIRLQESTPEADAKVCRLFAILHDCCRKHDEEDRAHGSAAASLVLRLSRSGQLGLDARQKKKLTEACRHHSDGQVSDDPSIGACWDADRMELTRVGIFPKAKFLSLPASKERLWTV